MSRRQGALTRTSHSSYHPDEMVETVKIAAVQIDPAIGANIENLKKIMDRARTAAASGARLIVFPECALTGYMFASRVEALPFSETIPGPSTAVLGALCRELGIHLVYGLLERDGDRCFNSAALLGPSGLIGTYRKNHLPFLGIDRFLDRGNLGFKVYETDIGKLGLFICYDCTFPESSRVMALAGADILVLPTNWPEGRALVPKHVITVRAFENKVHLVACDRVGQERGARFLGTSKIVNAWGETLAEASADREEIIFGEVKLSDARQKRIIFKPGEFEADFIHDRRPELYGRITRLD
jgi:5-aminopentanamidase